jgi:hypothetical protein
VKDHGRCADREEIIESDTTKAALVDISIDENKLISRLRSEPDRTPDELLEGITKDNIHPETETGIPIGRELLVIARAYVPDRGDAAWLTRSTSRT